MGWFTKAFTSTVGKKLIMSLTGLFLCAFLVIHLIGNLALFNEDGGEAFNAYSHFMSTNGIIKVMEILLVLGFLFHIIDSIVLTLKNRAARPVRYEVNKKSQNSDVFSRTMFITGGFVFLFLAIHFYNFILPYRITEIEGGATLFDLVIYTFQQPVWAISYIVLMVLLAFHLLHAFQSAFQTLGLNNSKYFPFIKAVGVIYSVIIPLGFASMPAYFLITKLTGGN